MDNRILRYFNHLLYVLRILDLSILIYLKHNETLFVVIHLDRDYSCDIKSR